MNVVALLTVTGNVPLYSASLAPLIVAISFVASPWGVCVTTVAVVPVEVRKLIGFPLNELAKVERNQNRYPVAAAAWAVGPEMRYVKVLASTTVFTVFVPL